MVVESSINDAISCKVSKTAGAVPTSLEISVLVSDLVYASIPSIVIELYVDENLYSCLVIIFLFYY